MKEFFIDILQYNFSMNEKLILFCEENSEKISEKAHLLLSHLVNSQNIWNRRIFGEQMVYGVWETIPYEILKKMNQENLDNSHKVLETIDLESIIHYKNLKGESLQRKAKDIVFHYTNHGTYHRAQIATDFKNTGLEPMVTDFIYYKG